MKYWLGIAFCVLLSMTGAVAVAAEAEVRFEVDEFVIEGEHPFGQDELKEMLDPYLGEHEGFLDLRNAAQTLEERLQSRGLPFHRVIIPPQRTATGRFRFEVVPFKLNVVEVEGNSHFDRDNVLNSVRTALVVEETPNTRELARALSLANNHPVKRVGVSMRRSERPNYIDAVLNVEDHSPHVVFLNANNRGSDDTGDERVALGYQYTNLFNRDHVITFTASSSPGHWDDVQQYGVNYVWPLYRLSGDLAFLYTFSDVDSGTVGGAFDVTGQGRFAGVHYTQYFLNRGAYRHRLRVSVEDRLFENNLDFAGQPQLCPFTNPQADCEVRSRPAALDYTAEWVLPGSNVALTMGYVYNLPRGADNDQQAYTGARVGADDNWGAARFGLVTDVKMPKNMLFRTRFSGQWTNEPLIPGEQFGLGGERSVRGFPEREVASDSGYQQSLELWLPANRSGIDFFAFTDAGYGLREDTLPGEDESLTLMSYGLGARWRPNRHFNLALDFARVLAGEGGVDDGDMRLHFNVLVRN